jgi:hypothetical protein
MTVTLYALVMVFGAIVASMGLLLLFRKHEESLSRIKIFGQEFQFSAPGLVVTLAGCILLVLFPVLGVTDRDVIVLGSPKEGHRYSVSVGGKEHEPNDNFDIANIIKFGTTTTGVLTTPNDHDFFKFQVPATLTGLPRVRIIVEKPFWAAATIYDENEQRVAYGDQTGESPVSFSFEGTPGALYYIVVAPMYGERGEYKLILRQE